MRMIYIITLEGEPQVAYEDIEKVRQACFDWLENHCNDYSTYKDFNYWVEDRGYPNTEEGEEQAWEDYKESIFEEGTWGDYAWHECYLK